MASGDIFEFRLQGNQASVWRGIAGALPLVQVPNIGGTIIIGAQGLTGRPGVGAIDGAGSAGNFAINTWSAGDFVTGPLPPTAPTGSQGAFTVRTT
jgi:hypothetical protein